jgi:hypothetical protein
VRIYIMTAPHGSLLLLQIFYNPTFPTLPLHLSVPTSTPRLTKLSADTSSLTLIYINTGPFGTLFYTPAIRL